MKWDGQGYELHAVNRRYTTPFRDSRFAQALQLAALFVVVFAFVVVVF